MVCKARDAERPRSTGNEGECEQNKIKVLTPPQIKALLGKVRGQKYRTMFMVAIFAGVREGELLGLKWSDVDWENSQIHVQRTFTAYVRENSPWKDESMQTEGKKEKPSADIQAVLTVLGRRALTYQKGEDYPLDVNHTDMINANLEEANLNGANFLYANLEYANLRGAQLEGANLSKANLSRADLRGANLRRPNLYVYSLAFAKLNGAYFERAEGVTKYRLAKTNCWALAFYDAKQLESFGLPSDHNERVRNKDLRNYQLQDADLSRADLRNANLTEANLQNAGLSQTNLQKAILYVANLQEADLRSANLYEGGLSRANLRRANLQKARRVLANLQKAYLVEANLEGANLWGADLGGADLQGTLSLTTKQLCKVKTLYEAKLDSELEKQIRKNWRHLLERPVDWQETPA